MECPECHRNFEEFKNYSFHLEYVHKVTKFSCPFKHCYRVYNRKGDLKKHIKNNHSSSIDNACTNDPQKSTVNIPLDKMIFNENSNSKAETVDDENVQNASNSISEDLKEFQNILSRSVVTFISKLYDDVMLPRNCVQSIIDGVYQMLNETLVLKFQKIFSNLTQSFLPKSSFECLISMINNFGEPFVNLNTEYKRIKFFEGNSLLLKPVEINIGISQHQKSMKDGEKTLLLKNQMSYYIPMEQTLRMFLELPNCFETIVKYQNSLVKNFQNGEPTQNIVHGTLFQNILCANTSDEAIILPLIIYFDDFQPGNPLGSQCNQYKIGSIYFTIATIPPQYASRLENLFLAYIFYSEDRITFGNKTLFKPLISKIKELETKGITIRLSNIEKKVNFRVLAITGDNLGVHGIMGCFESFSATNFCRFCLSSKAETEIEINENYDKIRQKCDYNRHLNDKIGLKESCVWHELTSFHLYDNLVCDIMHDLYEGVHRYDMALILSNLIEKKYFSLDLLNSRISCVVYEKSESNIPPRLTLQSLQNKCIICSAAEMLCLVKNLRFAVGDCVPEGDKTWNFYLILLKLTDVLNKPIISEPCLNLIDDLIRQHHTMYLSLFKSKLKPKHHFLLHYGRIIRKIGPPCYLSCMRFEAKHKEFKSVSHCTQSRRNLPYTLALKQQLKISYRFLCKRSLNDKIEWGPLHPVECSSIPLVGKCSTLDWNKFDSTSWYSINGMRYDLNNLLLLQVSDLNDCEFGQIIKILIDKSNSAVVFLLCELYDTVGYFEHLDAYEIKNKKLHSIFNLPELASNVSTVSHKMPNGKIYVTQCGA